MKFQMTFAAACLLAVPAMAAEHMAEGDAAAGEAVFNQCQSCHVVVNDEGETLAGRAGRTGPNLYGIAGRTAGTVEDFRYSKSMVEAGEAGLMWDQEQFVAYVQDPTGFLREYLDDKGARGKMSFKLRSDEDAANVYAYIKSLGGVEEMMEEKADG
ncbi:c-type cytochrome [Palleronia caenipelagi]|uniref:C-type cytochrome n=1 Tax=Palleronia caenipelagi TaxID=2489174 RepID=A0A547Q885_9RHOB|nr:c-type cytochrome [Palleronia caenipelagi]TRD22579.1 c-type cytochrome [Palleronia caenipelagi]